MPDYNVERFSPVRARAMAENELMDIEQANRRNALMESAARRQEQQFAMEMQDREAQKQQALLAQHTDWIKNAIVTARQNPQVIPSLVSEAKQRGLLPPEVQTLAPADIEELALHYGIAPQEVPKPEYRTVGDSLLQLGPDGPRVAYREPQRPVAAPSGTAAPVAPKFRPATPEEVSAAGLPEGTSAQVGADGKMSVLRAPSAADVRNQQQAKRFVPRVDALDRRVARVERAVEAFSKDRFVNTGPMDQAITRFMPKGQELEQAVNQAQTELQALTRIPGIGSQSDWEGRLQLLAWPSVGFDPAVNQRAISEIKSFVRDIQASVKEAAGLQPAPKSSGASGSFGEPAKQARQRYDANGKLVK